MPSTLPPSSTGELNGTEKPKYVVSASGHAAHPDEIIASCQALQAHLQKMQDDAEKTLKGWQTSIRERELAEKRRVAPGWLDRDEKILQPERRSDDATSSTYTTVSDHNLMDIDDSGPMGRSLIEQRTAEGEELDRAFGGMGIR